MDAFPPQDPPRQESSNAFIIGIVLVGMLVIFFALGKGIFDVATMPPLDLAADDSLEGFLPVYSFQGHSADPSLVSLDSGREDLAGLGYELSAFPTPQPGQAADAVSGRTPDRMVIPSIGLDATIIPIGSIELSYEDEVFQQWLAPEYRAVGWHETSAGLGAPGNTVLNGHHNVKGEVFRDLYRLQRGDQIQVYSNGEVFRYVVIYSAILPERNQPLDVRLANAEWIQPTEDERITIITCWPFESNTHRVLVVAVPFTASS